jgi:hypothetical protein
MESKRQVRLDTRLRIKVIREKGIKPALALKKRKEGG